MKRLSALQILAHAAAWLPLLALAVDFATGNLSVNPYQEAERRTGNIALILLLLSLACTPVNTLFRLPQVLRLRRPLGVYGWMVAALHLFIFVGLDYGFDLELILLDVGEKRFIIAGLVAFLLLTALAVTSFDWWKVKLRKGWKKLHRLVYLANLAVVLHFAWAVKGDFLRLQGDVLRPLLALLAVSALLALRLPPVRRRLAGRLAGVIPGRRSPRAVRARADSATPPARPPKP